MKKRLEFLGYAFCSVFGGLVFGTMARVVYGWEVPVLSGFLGFGLALNAIGMMYGSAPYNVFRAIRGR